MVLQDKHKVWLNKAKRLGAADKVKMQMQSVVGSLIYQNIELTLKKQIGQLGARNKSMGEIK